MILCTTSTSLIDELRPYVADERVLDAIAAVPRECFVPADLRDRAYDNRALGIGCGQTISQPLVVARMSELLGAAPGRPRARRRHRLGLSRRRARAPGARTCGRSSAMRGSRAARRATSPRAGVQNVTLVVGDGTRGLPEQRPVRRDQRRGRRQRRGRWPSSRPSSRPAGVSSPRSPSRCSACRSPGARPRGWSASCSRRCASSRWSATTDLRRRYGRRPALPAAALRLDGRLLVLAQCAGWTRARRRRAPPGSARRTRRGAPRARSAARR